MSYTDTTHAKEARGMDWLQVVEMTLEEADHRWGPPEGATFYVDPICGGWAWRHKDESGPIGPDASLYPGSRYVDAEDHDEYVSAMLAVGEALEGTGRRVLYEGLR